jgi:acyl-CoA thioesterase-1
MIFMDKIKYGLFFVVNKTVILLFVFFSSAQADNQIRILMLGDSLTQGYGLEEKKGLVPKLQNWLSTNNVEVLLINGGVSGDTTLGGFERLDWLLTPNINGVVVALGGNDLLRGFDPKFTKNNLQAIFKNLKSKGINSVIVGTISPLNYGPQFKKEYDAIYPSLARQYNLFYIDSLFSPLIDKKTREISVNLLQADGIHPNEKGVEAIVNYIGPVIKDFTDSLSQ